MSDSVGARFECLRCGKLWTVRPFEPAREYKCRECSVKLSPSPRAGTAEEYYPPELARVLKHRARRLGGFLLERRIGRGAAARVFRAWDDDLRRWVAIKVLRQDALDADDIARFRREAQIAAKAAHPNIVPVYQVGEANGRRFAVMKLVEGTTLAQHRFPGWRDLVKAMIDVCDGVGSLHRNGIVHRDLKPQNIMIDRQGKIVVMDFGIARSLNAGKAGMTTDAKPMGTPGFMPPEQAMAHSRKVDARSDVYALGVTLHVLIAGEAPSESATDQVPVREIPPLRSVPRGLEAVLRKATAAIPAERYGDAAELGSALSALLRSDAKRRAMLKIAAVVVAGLLTIAAGVGVLARKTRRSSETPVADSPSEVAPKPSDDRSGPKRPPDEPAPKTSANPDPWEKAREAARLAETYRTVAAWKDYADRLRELLAIDPNAQEALEEALYRMNRRGARDAEAYGDLAEAIRLEELALASKKTAEAETDLADLKNKKARADAYAAKMSEGKRALKENDPERAEKAFTDALEARENDPVARDGQKRARQAQGEKLYAAAMADAKKAAGEKRWADAKKAALRALDVKPDDLAARTLLGEAERGAKFEELVAKAGSLAKSKKFEDALAAVEAALKLKEGDAGALALERKIVADACKADVKRGGDFAEVQDWKNSEAAYQSALKRDPADADAQAGLKMMKAGRALDPPAFEVSKRWTLASKDGPPAKLDDLAVRDAAFSPDRTLLAIALNDGTIRLWDVESGKEVQILRGHTGKVTCVAFRWDGKMLASGGEDHAALIWSVSQKGTDPKHPFQSQPSPPIPLNGSARSVAWSPTQEILAIASASSHDVRLLYFRENQADLFFLKRERMGEPWGVAFSPDGKRLASSGADGTVNFWDPETRAWLGELGGVTAGVLGYPPADPVPKETKDNKAERKRALEENARKSRLLFFVPPEKDSGANSASTSVQDLKIRWWRPSEKAADKNAVVTLTGHGEAPLTGVLSKDGSILVTAGAEGKLFFWDGRSAEPRDRRATGQGRVTRLALSRDGRVLASFDDRGSVVLWRAPE